MKNRCSVQEVGNLGTKRTGDTAPGAEGLEAHSRIAGASTGSKSEGKRQLTIAQTKQNKKPHTLHQPNVTCNPRTPETETGRF